MPSVISPNTLATLQDQVRVVVAGQQGLTGAKGDQGDTGLAGLGGAANTLYVSASYTGSVVPMFNTIQAAIDAAPNDGTQTTIVIYPGIYAESPIAKDGIFLLGLDIDSVLIIGSTTTGSIVSFSTTESIPAKQINFGVGNLTIKNTGAGYNGLSIVSQNTASNTLNLKLKNIRINVGGIGWVWLGTNSGLSSEIELVNVQGIVGAVSWTDVPTTIKPIYCQFIGGISNLAYPTFSLNDLRFKFCRNETQWQYSGLATTVRWENSVFGTTFFSSFPSGKTTSNVTIVLRNCSGRLSSRLLDIVDSGSATITVYIENCAFEFPTSSGCIATGNGGNLILFVRESTIQNRISNFQSGGLGGTWKISCTNTTCYNVAAANVFEGGVAYSVFLWGFVSNGAYNASFVTIRPTSTNYSFSLSDVIGW